MKISGNKYPQESAGPRSCGSRSGSWRNAGALGAGFAGLVFLAFGFSLGLLAQVSRTEQRAKGFVKPEYYEADPTPAGAATTRISTNRLKAVWRGATGRQLPERDSVYEITELYHESYQRDGVTNLIIEAPHCLYQSDPRIASSTGAMQILALDGKFYIQGSSGFEARLTNSSLTVSNKVRTIIRQDLLPRPPKP